MKPTIHALQCRPRISFRLQRQAAFACFHNLGKPRATPQSRVLQRNTTTSSTKENFHRVPDATPIEEELFPGYKADDYCPVITDQNLDSRYHIICKLGCGIGSTVWLANDVKISQYRAVKVCTRTTDGAVPAQAKQEIAVAEYLKTAHVQQHPGRRSVRTALDSFTLNGPHGTHTCLVYVPQGMTFTEIRDYLPENRLAKRMLQASVQLLLIALDYLHKNSIVHTDISPNNILVGTTDDTPFSQLEKDEQACPVARKVLSDRTIYMSRPVPQTNGQLVLSDMGSARFGQETFTGDIMPDVYRAPEVILGIVS